MASDLQTKSMVDWDSRLPNGWTLAKKKMKSRIWTYKLTYFQRLFEILNWKVWMSHNCITYLSGNILVLWNYSLILCVYSKRVRDEEEKNLSNIVHHFRCHWYEPWHFWCLLSSSSGPYSMMWGGGKESIIKCQISFKFRILGFTE